MIIGDDRLPTHASWSAGAKIHSGHRSTYDSVVQPTPGQEHSLALNLANPENIAR